MIDTLTPIERSELEGKDPVILAKWLLNKYLISSVDNCTIITRIIETEAYKAPEDKASHAYGNKKTKRTQTMFQKGGISYVYLCYGLHQMFNVVTGPEGVPHAILIRALQPIHGIQHIKSRRNISNPKNYCNGPGKLCQALGISKMHNGIDICNSNSPIWIGNNQEVKAAEIDASPRVGIDYAEEWVDINWRFRIKGSY